MDWQIHCAYVLFGNVNSLFYETAKGIPPYANLFFLFHGKTGTELSVVQNSVKKKMSVKQLV